MLRQVLLLVCLLAMSIVYAEPIKVAAARDVDGPTFTPMNGATFMYPVLAAVVGVWNVVRAL